jgi:D-glycero-D-manno-heptose 1,7-bisphosphate phosphatase
VIDASRLIVLDRDGVINEDSALYIRSLRDWRPIPGSIEAIGDLCRAGFSVVVASNQSGIGRGLLDEATLYKIHGALRDAVRAAGGDLMGIYYCPHVPDENCDCRKPKPGLLDQIAADFGGSLAGAMMVGDSLRDLQSGVARGLQPVLVRTGKGRQTERDLHAQPAALGQIPELRTFDDLAAAARWLSA